MVKRVRHTGVSRRRQQASAYQELYSGLIRLHVLHHACQEPIYGLEMIEELSRHGYRIGPGTLYPILHGLEERNWLRSEKELNNGKIRRVYRATASGKKALAAAQHKVRELFGELFGHERQNPKAWRGSSALFLAE